jgi:hypothetical protein
MKRLLLLLPVLLLLSFSTPEGQKFSNSGVSFNIPAGWKITEQEDIEGKGYYLSCEKDGENSSGLVTITWVNDSTDLKATAVAYGNALKENFKLKKADTKLTPAVKRTFNGRSAMGMDYTLMLSNILHEGHIYCFYGNEKTITVMVQEAVEDKAVNKSGIQEILSSLTSE